MDYLVVSLAALLVAALTLFSGFGLGTLLLPVFALFFPMPVAVAATAVVHLANNVFRVFLVGRKADGQVVLRFALPGAGAAVAGAALLLRLSGLGDLYVYSLAGREFHVTPVKLVIALLMIAFALFDLVPRLGGSAFDRKYLVLGGILSGFFGGLSGHQGALRSAFLVKSGLAREAFVGTNVLSAVVVDVSRLIIYGAAGYAADVGTIAAVPGRTGLVPAAVVAAFIGSFVGARLIRKVTMKWLQQFVGVMLLAVALLLGAGLV